MEDISEKLMEVLKNPDTITKIQKILGETTNQSGDGKGNSDDINQLNNLNTKDLFDGVSPEMLGTMMKLVPLISSVNSDDKYDDFLRSLRPLLSGARQKKLDESSKFIKLIKILPMLKENGII